jgi:hypothetical protein
LEKGKVAVQEGQDEAAVALKLWGAIISFLDDDLDVKAARLTQLPNSLAVAVRDLLLGMRPALLFLRPKRRGQPSGRSFQAARAVAAALADLLITNGEPSDVACRCVANELHRAGVAGPRGKITPQQVLRWWHDVGGASPTLTESTYKSLRAKFDRIPRAPLADREGRRQFVRGAIEAIVSAGIQRHNQQSKNPKK